MKDFFKEYLSFTKKERAGILIILILISAGMIIPFLFSKIFPEKENDIYRFKADLNAFKKINEDSLNSNHGSHFKLSNKKTFDNFKSFHEVNPVLFEFDPNTITPEEWIKLGVREKTALTIEKYVSKGGHFYKPDDLSKIYGLHQNDIERLKPYVRIANKRSAETVTPKNTTIFHNKKYERVTININTADSSVFSTLPGIGPSFSRRIVHFRNKLGGFYSVDQLAETYGLADSVFQKIKPQLVVSATDVKKINLNTASPEELRAHPYIRYQIANSIIQYRKQHGSFSDVSELKKIMIIDDKMFFKIQPYLSIN